MTNPIDSGFANVIGRVLPCPRRRAKDPGPIIHPALEQRLQRIESRLKILDSEVKGEFNLSDYYVKPETITGPEESAAS